MYATAAQLYEYLPQVEQTLANTARLETILTRATGIVRDALRAALADPAFDYADWGVAATKTIRSYGGEYLWLPPHQAGSITSVVYGTYTLDDAAYGATTSGALQALEVSGLSYPLSWAWPRGADWGLTTYIVTAVWGYGPDVPAAIEEVTLELAVNLWRARDSGGYVTAIGAEGEGSVRVVSGLNKLQQQVIANVAAQLSGVAV